MTSKRRPERAGDVTRSLADRTAARRVLESEPIVAFGDGLPATVEWHRSTPRPTP